MIKTYGVKGYMEWTALIKVGRVNFQVPFTGGAKSGYGMTPATYTCREKVFQKVLENSDYFKSGKIFLVRSVEEEADKTHSAHPEGREVVPTPDPSPREGSDTTGKGAASDDVTTVKVSDRAEAKQYLMDTFGLSAGSLRTKGEIERVGKAHGVLFEGLE